jgi:hypothetical protein
MRDYLNVTMLPDHYGWVMKKIKIRIALVTGAPKKKKNKKKKTIFLALWLANEKK